MPSIFDELEFQEYIEKLAQQVNQQISPGVLQVAQKLLNNLMVSPFSAEKDNANLYPRDILNLSSLINFLHLNKVKFNMQEIVSDIPHKELPNEYVPFKAGFGDVFVWKNGLITYLKDLYSQAEANGNNLLKTMLDKLMAEANSALNLGYDASKKQWAQVPFSVDNSQEKSDDKTQNQKEDNKSEQNNQQNQDQQSEKKQIDNVFQKYPHLSEGPFDVNSYMINLNRITTFVQGTFALLQSSPNLTRDFSYNLNTVNSNGQEIIKMIQNWQSFAPMQAKNEVLFNYDDPNQTKNFIDRFVKNYDLALNMINALRDICGAVQTFLQDLAQSNLMMQVFSKEMIIQQNDKATRYMTAMQNSLNTIPYMKQNAINGIR